MKRRQFILALLATLSGLPVPAGSLDLGTIKGFRINAGYDGYDFDLIEKFLTRLYLISLNQGEIINEHMGQKVVDQDAQNALKSIAKPLWAASTRDLEWNIILTNSKITNACTPGGGLILIYCGLLKECREEAELASVIAHEIGHIHHKHAIKRMMTKMVNKKMGINLDHNFIKKAAMLDEVSMQMLMEKTVEIIQTSYTRLFEHQADAFIIPAFLKAGYPPFKASLFFRKLQYIFGSESPSFCIYDSHPSTEERIKRLDAIAASYNGDNERSDSEAFKKLKIVSQSVC